MAWLIALALLAFAGNSLLCRVALTQTPIDPASFTSVRLLSGAVCLWLLVRQRDGAVPSAGNWPLALALFSYAAAFSFAYTQLNTATGALLLFGAVQASMIGWGFVRGERLRPVQWLGWLLALGGLVGLVLPGLSAPPWQGSLLMVWAGLSWTVYTLRGRSGGSVPGDPLQVTAGNFARAVIPALLLSALAWRGTVVDVAGLACAVASGALASGVGYAIWFAVVPHLRVTSAATLQLSVPVIAALGGVLVLGETLSARLLLATPAILGGVALVVWSGTQKKAA